MGRTWSNKSQLWWSKSSGGISFVFLWKSVWEDRVGSDESSWTDFPSRCGKTLCQVASPYKNLIIISHTSISFPLAASCSAYLYQKGPSINFYSRVTCTMTPRSIRLYPIFTASAALLAYYTTKEWISVLPQHNTQNRLFPYSLACCMQYLPRWRWTTCNIHAR